MYWLPKSKKVKIGFILIIIALFLFIYIFIGKIKTATIPDGYGVNIHFTGKQVDINLIHDAGFKMARTDIFWSSIEEEKGVYDFENNGYDTLTKELMKAGIRPYYVLDYSNLLYEEHGASIVTDKGREAFNRYVDEVTSRYKNKGIIWEVWNEPNLDSWEPQPNIHDYSLLLKESVRTIKKNDPSGFVVAPALAGISDESLKWFEDLFKTGALDNVDAISVHPYRTWEPESVAYEYELLRELVKKYTSKKIPIISGEWGYSTANGWWGMHLSEEQQAAFLVRMFLINKLNDIPISIWYGWENDGSDPNNGEHNFGLRQENTAIPKLAYHAMYVFNYMLSDYQLIERMDLGNPDDYLLKFTNKKDEMILVMWTIKESHGINIPFPEIKGPVFTMLGKESHYYHSEQDPIIELSEDPVYLIVE